jgi:predicted aspartyl protease
MAERINFRLAGGENPLILVPVYVDGHGPYEFILDTGASLCLVSPDLSASLGIRAETEKQGVGAGGAVKLRFGHAGSISVGSARQENVAVAITDEIQRVGAAIRSRVDGVLGFGFLKEFILEINYGDNSLRLSLPIEESHGSKTRSFLPFTLAFASKPLILVPAVVNGQGPFSFALDTGASRTMLSVELARKLPIATADDTPVTAGGGLIKILAGRVNSLAVGGATVHDHAIGAGEFLNMLSEAIGTKLDGIIGHNFLNQFKVTIDYPRQVLELTAGA